MAGAGWLHIFNYQSHATGGMEAWCRVQGTQCTAPLNWKPPSHHLIVAATSHQPPATRLLTGHRGKLDLENEAAAGCGGRGAERGAAEEGHLHEIVSRGGCGPVTATAPATPRPADNFSISALSPDPPWQGGAGPRAAEVRQPREHC